MKKRFIAILLLAVVIYPTVNPFAYAQDASRLEELDQEQKELEKKVQQARSGIKTLNDQISFMDNKIRLTTLQIYDTEKKIDVLENDIDVLSRKIVRVEDSLSLLQQTLLNRIRASYAIGGSSTLELYLSSNGFTDAVTSMQYLEILQKNDIKLLSQMQSTKQNYGDQKTSLVDRQQRLEEARAELDKQSNLLTQQKGDKEKLLSATKNDEKRYQQLLALSRAEARAIEAAIASSANLKNGVSVKKGDIIALIGNSGAPACSTGAHLHFEVRKNGTVLDPAGYLKSQNVTYDNSPDGSISFAGNWEWPILNAIITQGYGMTYWARTGFYQGGPHNGIDMVSRTSAGIRAVENGTLYKSSMKCGSSILKYAVLDHGSGVRSYYLHIQ